MDVTIELRDESGAAWVPRRTDCVRWLREGLEARDAGPPCSLSLRFVDREESRRLNGRWRSRDRATGMLSFPAPLPEAARRSLARPPLGDVVLCPAVLEREAADQGKPLPAHWAHLLIHGVLHLLGHDHRTGPEARRMERREIRALARLGFPNPYLIG